MLYPAYLDANIHSGDSQDDIHKTTNVVKKERLRSSWQEIGRSEL